MFFEEYLEYEMITIFHYEDISRKQPHRVIFDPLMHLRVKALWDELWFVNMGYTNKILLIDW